MKRFRPADAFSYPIGMGFHFAIIVPYIASGIQLMIILPKSKDSACSVHSLHTIPLPNGLMFHLNSREMLYSAKFVFNEIFVQQRYYRKGFELRPDDTVVDIGANMGMFVMWASPQIHNGRILAIEPARQPLDCLKMNVEKNGLKNVTAKQAAVGKRGDRLEMVEYPELNVVSHHSSFRTPLLTRLWNYRRRKSAIRTTSVCVSLDDLMDDHHLDTINYLKIDCEGGEYDILRSLPSRYWERIEKISLEFHELCPGQNHRELVSCLQNHGFQVEVSKPFFNFFFFKTGEIWGYRPARNCD
jgi:FkbM family methyltransferase